MAGKEGSELVTGGEMGALEGGGALTEDGDRCQVPRCLDTMRLLSAGSELPT